MEVLRFYWELALLCLNPDFSQRQQYSENRLSVCPRPVSIKSTEKNFSYVYHLFLTEIAKLSKFYLNNWVQKKAMYFCTVLWRPYSNMQVELLKAAWCIQVLVGSCWLRE